MHPTAPADLPLALAVTGASGAPYWRRLLQVLLARGREVHLACSSNADTVCRAELGRPLEEVLEEIVAPGPGLLRRFAKDDFLAPMASGSARYAGMAVVPCSLGTLGRIATGTSSDLITRAADVMLKEKRRLVLLFRDTPLNLIHLENMVTLARAGAVIMPAAPGFYHGARGMDDLVDFVVQRICDQLGVPCELHRRWGEEPPPSGTPA
jgi:4-hydroxy-3-polyprenylbenzoate decarboxylase